ncbi:meiosis-specific coiled-coil domain-containing protein MEIOC [Mugil cephalus]|uniref:meiosis-specific coiled-coil domain-containing protein MEIOC n=1 Tax=Mugil cephalus TaxID=48193 RepID=UPI001FB5D9AD|nr:meiosis-specific coiled-coil domain-containing protein MEIOC [Mugil cephalus]
MDTRDFRVTLNGHQGTFAQSPFLTYQRQEGDNVRGGDSGSMASTFVSLPSASLQELNTAAYVPWSHNTQEDPYELICCTQSSIKSRKWMENADYERETDLQGLVSNILEEADSQDSYYSEGSLPTCSPIWSPKTLREELLQYVQSEPKTQHSTSYLLNCVSHGNFNKAQQQSVGKDVEEFSQVPSSVNTSQQWLFNLPNGDSHAVRPQKLPPGLPLPNAGNTYPSQIQQSKYVSMSACNDLKNSNPMSNFPDLSNIFEPESVMDSPCFDSFSDDQHTQSCVKSVCNEQYVPEDINPLVNSFQSFMASEHDGIRCGDFPIMHKKTGGMHREDSMTEPWKFASFPVSTQTNTLMQTPKQPVGEFETMQRDRNEGVSKQAFKPDGFSDFNPQSAEYLHLSHPFSAPLNLTNQHQNKMRMHRESINARMNQYSKSHIQQSQTQNKIKPQVQKEKRRMPMSGFPGEAFTRRPQTNTHMREGDTYHQPQSQYTDFQANMQSQRFDGQNSVASAGQAQQYMPFVYSVNDSIKPTSSNFSFGSALPYGSGVSGMDVGDKMSANDFAAFKAYISDIRSCRGESTYHGMASVMTASSWMNQGGHVIQSYVCLDACFEQWRCLEKDRKRVQVILTKTFLGKRTGAVTNTNLPKTSPNPSRVEYLIVNQMREQAKVATLLDRMESLCDIPLHSNIRTVLHRHHMAICITQARYKEDVANMTKHQRQRPHFPEGNDTFLMIIALKDLAATTRKLRTALWCALEMTLLKPVKTQDHHVSKDTTCTERCVSPFEGYYFKL